jgi:hypothetical protein
MASYLLAALGGSPPKKYSDVTRYVTMDYDDDPLWGCCDPDFILGELHSCMSILADLRRAQLEKRVAEAVIELYEQIALLS